MEQDYKCTYRHAPNPATIFKLIAQEQPRFQAHFDLLLVIADREGDRGEAYTYTRAIDLPVLIHHTRYAVHAKRALGTQKYTIRSKLDSQLFWNRIRWKTAFYLKTF